ncbi:MAG TPA: hypothetical protein VL588_01930 [Bdellovibrionota bacterium]|nr:hypothetical protein [Bdellovibrionota bacterium]
MKGSLQVPFVLVSLFAAVPAWADLGGLGPMPYDTCRTMVEAMGTQRYDREIEPITAYLRAATIQAADDATYTFLQEFHGVSHLESCPPGYHPSEGLSGRVCAPAPKEGFYPNAEFLPPQEREITRLGDSSIRVCVKAAWLIYSLGSSHQELCVRFGMIDGAIKYFDHTDELSNAIRYGQKVKGDDAGDGTVDGVAIPTDRETFFRDKVLAACGEEPTDPSQQVCVQH